MLTLDASGTPVLTGAIVAQILMLEERLLTPATRRDPLALADLLAEGFFEIGAWGATWDRAAVLAALPDENAALRTLSDFRVHPVSAEVVLATYHCLKQADGAATRSLRSSLWVWREGAWRLAFHQGTAL
ncbi:DUF4440 domain-containing protein [Pseudomonas sp. RP23018S]|uniref:nuclear transport factor 2 family protein n=1 Tax=Pseudomonas sp. RP23018S TaxID=3096037 RepID=UPI002ACA9F8A|nr:DUF4440 domain-containing protein [Pseudomonas sp. RP23018S]MDZ5603860.1 DUF4440 domain-containing protein [Pseudomonas sp. RP23018S]